jgi:hypothetical protein
MKFAFDTDEVFRDTLNKMIAVYEKFFIEDYVYEEGEEEFKYEIIKPITSYNFSEHFKFPSEGEYINFMYMDFPMNICGHAPSISANTFNTLSTIQKTTLKKKDKLSIIAKAIAKQKPATLFFLSKYGTEVDEVVFYNKKNLKKMWNKFDVIVTANPDLLEGKPKNKISIKVESSYNTDSVSDYTINNLEGFTSIYNQL